MMVAVFWIYFTTANLIALVYVKLILPLVPTHIWCGFCYLNPKICEEHNIIGTRLYGTSGFILHKHIYTDIRCQWLLISMTRIWIPYLYSFRTIPPKISGLVPLKHKMGNFVLLFDNTPKCLLICYEYLVCNNI